MNKKPHIISSIICIMSFIGILTSLSFIKNDILLSVANTSLTISMAVFFGAFLSVVINGLQINKTEKAIEDVLEV